MGSTLMGPLTGSDAVHSSYHEAVYDAPSTVAPLLLALILGVSGVAKLANLSTAADAFVSLRLPGVLLRLRAPQLLPFGELLLALGLLVTSGVLQVLTAALALLVFVAYFVVIVRALTFNERVTCSCFGKLGLGSVDRFTALRNAVLVALAVLTVLDAIHGRSVLARWAEFSGADWWWLLGLAAAIMLTWLVTGHRGPSDVSGARTGDRVDAGSDEEYLRVPIPIGRLHRPDNSVVTLRALARTEAVLLLYVSPTCGSCVNVIQKARDWQHRTDVVHTYLVLPMPPAAEIMGLADPEAFSLLFDPQSEMFNLFESGTPTAVLLGADGRLAGGPVVGYNAVSALMDDILVELEAGADAPADLDAGLPHNATEPERNELPAAGAPAEVSSRGTTRADAVEIPDEDHELDYVRRPTPYGLLRNRDGAPVPVISLADHAPTILLFVSPGCGSCRAVIASVPDWRAALGPVPLALVVRDETAAESVETILDAPAGDLYLDPAGDVQATFQISSPGLVALGPDRLLLAGPVIGTDDVNAAMDEIIVQVAGNSGHHEEAEQGQAPAATTVTDVNAAGHHEPLPLELDAASGRPLPPMTPLTRRDGSTVMMRKHGSARQQLLAFLSPGCEACDALADLIPGWRAELSDLDVVVVGYGSADVLDVEPLRSLREVLFDVTGEFGRKLGILTPALLLVGRDGTVAGGPVSGLVECREFVTRIKEMYAAQG